MHYFKFILILALILFLSCTGNNSEQDILLEDSTIQVDISKNPDKDFLVDDNLIWSADFDSAKGDFVLMQHKKVSTDTLTPEKLIKEINIVWPDILLVFKKISNDTVYVAIPNSHYLTQSIGSSGAANYISSATFNLTELRGIKFVNFDFEEGDHVAPGTKSRNDFKNYR